MNSDAIYLNWNKHMLVFRVQRRKHSRREKKRKELYKACRETKHVSEEIMAVLKRKSTIIVQPCEVMTC